MIQKIMVIEDDESVAELLNINLTRRGFQVTSVESGETALDLVFTDPPQLILLDIRLPGISGWEVCRQIRANPLTRNIHVIILTAAVQKKDMELAEECGADQFLPKPFDIRILLNMIYSLKQR